ncbi:MAG: MotA/TolQ/ExbB proton channel family protein [Bacteroidetes bacterium]|nr:MotA/TolQ/ExbB proton channel family protein [Bacteroidota bacterium]MBP6425150.1 MotA/TolQ/ExbB proton channel family protein [Flavobacterium sp.]MBP7257654.1 MotA/TolQ/ExbB proton channel family protein [Chitinophagales bacterium]MBK7137979.1 MotA/TolQ/ExbB proton channel family protein [Bacteroidota bacterium]MBK9354746.1 MotA/TolQ/ExbB proton channel family protein [Bacteroidota bacterium]
MSAKQPISSSAQAMKSSFAMIAIPIIFVVSVLIYIFVLGSTANFEGGDPVKGHPLNTFGTIHKGGFIVPFLMTCLLTVIVVTIERFISLGKASGKGNVADFVVKIRSLVKNGEIEKGIKECDAQAGVVANVTKAGLLKYIEMGKNNELDNEKKELGISKDIEEATQLEMPMLEKNLSILATLASISTLLGLVGTVLGMIRAFGALATTGTPDTAALATGISEALINTAFGIFASMLAIIFYNYFTSKIDSLTYGIDEAGFSIVQSFASKNH